MRPEYIISFFIALGVSIIINLIFACIRNLNHEGQRNQTIHTRTTRTLEMPQRNQGAMPRTTASPPALPGIRNTNQSVGTVLRGGGITPALPNRPRETRRNPVDYPRCPIHKCCNRIGEAQKIFRGERDNTWLCYRGHTFNS